MRGVVRRAAPPFPAVLNKFIFKGSRGEFVILLPQEPENVLRPGLICRRQQIDKSTKFGLPWPTRSHPPAPPRPSPRAQDQVATLPLLGSFRCFELPFSRRGWPWCCIKILFWGALEGDRLAALRRTGAARTRGWVIAGDRGSTGPPKKLTQETVNSRTLLAHDLRAYPGSQPGGSAWLVACDTDASAARISSSFTLRLLPSVRRPCPVLLGMV